MQAAIAPSRWERKTVLAIVILGALARVFWYCYNPSLWNDEAALANNIIKYSFQKIAVTPLDDLQAAPPGYLLAEKALGSLGGYSELSLRLFSLLCGLAALFVFAKVAGETLTGMGRVAAVALFSFSGPLIYHSAEVKQYETEVLASVVLLWLAVRWRDDLGLRQALAAGVIGMVCVLFANTALFTLAGVFAAQGLGFLWRRRYREAAHVMLELGLPFAAFAAFYLLVLRHNPNVAALKATWSDHLAPIPDSKSALAWYARTAFFALDHPLGLSLDLNFPFLPHRLALKYLLALSYPGALLLAVGAVVFLRRAFFLGLIVVSPVLVTLAASLLQQYPLNERLILYLCPVAYLLIGKAAELGNPEEKAPWRLGARVAAAWMLGYVAVNLAAKLAHPGWFGSGMSYSQMREGIEVVAAHKEPDDPVYLMWNTQGFYKYYDYRLHLNWKIITGADPRNGAASEAAVARNAAAQIAAAIPANGRVWFLLEDQLALLHFSDAKGVEQEAETPTGVLFEKVLTGQYRDELAEKFNAHAVGAYLVAPRAAAAGQAGP